MDCGVAVREGGVADLVGGGGLPGGRGGFTLGLGGGTARFGKPGFEGLSTSLGGSSTVRCGSEGAFLLGNWGGVRVGNVGGGGWDGGGGRLGG